MEKAVRLCHVSWHQITKSVKESGQRGMNYIQEIKNHKQDEHQSAQESEGQKRKKILDRSMGLIRLPVTWWM